MTIPVDNYEVATPVAARPKNKTNTYAFSPNLAKAAHDLPVDGSRALLVTIPSEVAKPHGFIRALQIHLEHADPEDHFEVAVTAAGGRAQVVKTRPPAKTRKAG